MNIYDLRGPEFLQIVLASQFVALGLAFLARKAVLSYTPVEPGPDRKAFDHYEAAYLNGGTKHLFLTVLTVLEHEGKIELRLAEKTAALKVPVDSKAHILERLVANALWKNHTSLSQVYDLLKSKLGIEQENLLKNGLVPSREQASLAAILPFQIVMIPVLFLMMPKIFIGMSHHKPVLFLFLLMAASVVLAICCLFKEARRTAEGQRVLDDWKREQTALKENFKSFATSMNTRDLALAYALFAAFAFNLLNPYKQALASNSGTNLWSYQPASYASGGCGSGGGGCGGGGCGGGCGGCGGS